MKDTAIIFGCMVATIILAPLVSIVWEEYRDDVGAFLRGIGRRFGRIRIRG